MIGHANCEVTKFTNLLSNCINLNNVTLQGGRKSLCNAQFNGLL